MSRRTPLLCALLALAAACTPKSGQGLDHDALDAAIGRAVGDPATCVMLADRASGKVVYRFGDGIECARTLPRCDGPGTITVQGALALATQPGGRMVSCPSNADGSRTVGWAAGKVPNTKRDLIYSAVMEGERALPGQEIAARLADAFGNAGV
jgi:hypothetical protein